MDCTGNVQTVNVINGGSGTFCAQRGAFISIPSNSITITESTSCGVYSVTPTPTVTQTWYYYQGRAFDCRFPGTCDEGGIINFKSVIPLTTGYYCDSTFIGCGGYRITGSATPNQSYSEWDYPNRTFTSGVCSQGMCP
jgi:hypothetical protein